MLQESDPELSVSHRCQADGLIVEVIGELHLPNVQQLRKPLQQVVSEHGGSVVLDFRRVFFMDSAGMKALVDARKQLSLQGRPFSLLVAAGSQPDRVMRTSRLDTIISLLYD